MDMKTKSTALITGTFLALACAHLAAAPATTPLALRCETNGVFIHGGVTSRTLENSFGANPLGLAFTGTNTYDFYSPPLSAPITLTTSAKGGATIVMTNTAPTSANDFQAGAMMGFYDYDPVAGVDTLIVNAGNAISPPQNVNHGQMAQWSLIQNPLPANYTIPVGHEVHVVVIVSLISGNPGSYGQVLYNGPSGATTIALLPQNLSLPGGWPLGSVVTGPPQILSIVANPDPSMQLNCSGGGGGTYLIQATTNLASPSSWITISTNVAGTNGLFQFTDTGVTNYPCRFYRASTP